MNESQAIQAIKNMTFGIEIECMFPMEQARSLGIRTTSSNWSSPIYMGHIQAEDGIALADWGASWDQTITRREGYTPIEFNSKILKGEEGFKSVVRFFKWLNQMGAQVDTSCGLHIHLGIKEMVRGMDIDQSIDILLKTLKFGNACKTALFAQGGSARRYFESRWTRSQTAHLRNNAEERAGRNQVPCFGGKYFFINTRNISDHGMNGRKATIEFRAFAGTTNYLKVLTHLSTCLTIAYTGMILQRSSWEGHNQTADKGRKAFDALAGYMSKSQFLKQFPTFEANKRKMWKIGRKMADKFQTRAIRWANNGRVNLENYR